MSKIDAVITDLKIQIESRNDPLGHYLSLRFIDIKPSFPKVQKTIIDLEKNNDLDVVGYKYKFSEIDCKTDLSYLEFTRH
jgi:hypothetical protein